MGKVLLLVILGLGGVVGYRFYSQYDLEERASAFTRALHDRALAARRGADSVPREDEITAIAEQIAGEYKLEVSDVSTSIREGAHPGGVGGMAADRMGEIAGQAAVGANGQVARGPSLSLKTTLVEVHAHIHAKGFLCALDRDVQTSANFGYALQ